MKHFFYSRMAWHGIRGNRRLYLPYLLTCSGMVMMYYIVDFLTSSSLLDSLRGGAPMRTMLGLGRGVIGIFALIFLFYTNSFLIKGRKKEFGLYNILGMGKRNLSRMLVWESVMLAVLSLATGLLAGIALSKLAELGMVNIMHGEVGYAVLLVPGALLRTAELFLVIHGLILLNTLRQIQTASPIELLRSRSAGERPPRANWFLALAGAVILGAAYYLAVSIEDVMTAFGMFFVAVAMVIVATYLLFIAGSVAACRWLQKRKRYYYKTNHFVSVSSMVYRMKRNGAGLASICILCTMVLVMLSAVVCLYAGTEDSLRSRYPRNIMLDTRAAGVELLNGECNARTRELVARTVEQAGWEQKDVLDYRAAEFAGCLRDGVITAEPGGAFSISSYADVRQVFVVPLEDYNRLMGRQEELEPGEVLVYATKSGYKENTVTLLNGISLQVKKTVDRFVGNGVDAMQIIPSVFLFVPDFEELAGRLQADGQKTANEQEESSPQAEAKQEESGPQAEARQEESSPQTEAGGTADSRAAYNVQLHWMYGFDLDCAGELQIEIQERIQEGLQNVRREGENEWFIPSCEGVAGEREEFYGLYGGLLFLGILLGIVFVFAAVLMMYYKQISEGLEDQSRFEIMQKVGMTRKEIKRSINSQILTVFFLPLLGAGLHLTFAFPMISKLLAMFALTNQRLLILVTIVSFLIFAVFYSLVYRITSQAYYGIVSGNGRKAQT